MIRTLILAAYGIVLIGLALRSLKAQRLRERYVLLFCAIGLPFLILAAWPDAIVLLADRLQIEKPTLLVLLVTGFIVLVLFELLSIVSVHERRLSMLAQHAALLAERLNAEQTRTNRAPAEGEMPTQAE